MFSKTAQTVRSLCFARYTMYIRARLARRGGAVMCIVEMFSTIVMLAVVGIGYLAFV